MPSHGTFARMWCNFITQLRGGSICIPYILRGVNLQIFGRFSADFRTFKPHYFATAQDIPNLKHRTEATHITESFCKIQWTSAQWLLGTMLFSWYFHAIYLKQDMKSSDVSDEDAQD